MGWSEWGRWWWKVSQMGTDLVRETFHYRNGTEIIAIMNQKGGCGKTATAVNLAASLAEQGAEILLVDIDPQAHATISLGFKSGESRHTLYDVLLRPEIGFGDILLRHGDPSFYVAPSSPVLASALVDLLGLQDREIILKEKLKAVAKRFDFVLIDCPPALSILTVNALSAANWVMIPIQLHFLAIDGMRELLNSIDVVRERFNPHLDILGILATLYDRRLKSGDSVLAGLRSTFEGRLFETVVRYSTPLAEASLYGKPVTRYSPYSAGARDYKELAREVNRRVRSIKRNEPEREPPEKQDLPTGDHFVAV